MKNNNIGMLTSLMIAFAGTFSYDRASGSSWEHCFFLGLGVGFTALSLHRIILTIVEGSRS